MSYYNTDGSPRGLSGQEAEWLRECDSRKTRALRRVRAVASGALADVRGDTKLRQDMREILEFCKEGLGE